jgi:hypothetical protein
MPGFPRSHGRRSPHHSVVRETVYHGDVSMSVRSSVRGFVSSTAPARPVAVFRAALGLGAGIKAIDLLARLLAEDEVRFAEEFWLGEVLSVSWPFVLLLWLLAATALFVGFKSRISAGLITGLSAVLIFGADFYSNHLYFLATMSLLLVFTDCGATLSVDSRRNGSRETVAAWPLWLIQFQVSVVYGFSALGKLNSDFLLGNVVYYRLSDALMFPADLLIPSLPLFTAVSVGTVVAEIFIAVGLWIERIRSTAFALGLGLHLLMIVMLTNTPQRGLRLALFALLTLSSYILFLKVSPNCRVLTWDSSSVFWSRTVRWLERLDWLRVIQFREVTGSRSGKHGVCYLEMQESTGKAVSDFEALSRAFAVLPLTFLWAPYLRLSPVKKVGGKLLGRLSDACGR